MGLLDDLEAATEYRPLNGPRCSVCRLYQALPADEAAALDRAFANPSVIATAIARTLQKNGFDVKPLAVQRHRRGDCRGTR